MENLKEDINEEITETKSKVSTSTSKSTKADLEKQLVEIQAKYEALLASQATTPQVTVSAPSTDVSLVYLSDSLGVVIGSNCTLNCTRYGEEFVLSRVQFDEIVGRYRSWFDKGILAVSYKNMDVALAKGLKTDKEYALNAQKLMSLGAMSIEELQKLWDETTLPDQKLSIVTFFKRKYIEGADQNYKNREKIDLLNRLTDGGFMREIQELSGYNLKINPTEF